MTITAYEISGNATLSVDTLARVEIEVSLEGEWIGLFGGDTDVRWGKVKADWTSGNTIDVNPCDDQSGSNPDTSTTITLTILWPSDQTVSDADLEEGDVVPYVLWPEDATKGILFPIKTTSTNALLDGDHHTDTLAQTVTAGAIVIGNSTPKWTKLAVGSLRKVLAVTGSGTIGWDWVRAH